MFHKSFKSVYHTKKIILFHENLSSFKLAGTPSSNKIIVDFGYIPVDSLTSQVFYKKYSSFKSIVCKSLKDT